MAASKIDLVKLFGAVSKTLAKNKTDLNQADSYNHDHGDNMVQIFELITQAIKEKKSATPADQLAYASQILRAKSQSGSAKLYAEGLSDAADQYKGKKAITSNNAISLVQTLLGAQGTVQSPSDSGDPLSGLLRGLSGSSQSGTGSGGDLLGSLLGGLSVAQPSEGANQQSGQLDIGQILNAGMAFVQTKQSGGSTLDGIMNAVMSSSRMAGVEHRTQSGTLVANTLLQVIGNLAKKK